MRKVKYTDWIYLGKSLNELQALFGDWEFFEKNNIIGNDYDVVRERALAITQHTSTFVENLYNQSKATA